MERLLAIGIGGFLGAIGRYGLSGVAQRCFRTPFPVGTWCVNTLGCLVMGMLMALVEERPLLGPGWRSFLLIGLLGSFTTFSTFGYETLVMIRDGRFLSAMANTAANVVLGLAAVWLGSVAARGFRL